jgi:hypothetical protein
VVRKLNRSLSIESNGVMANWYLSRERFKSAASISGGQFNDAVDRVIEASSRDVDRWTRRHFIPKTQTRLYRYPQGRPGIATVLWVDQDLLSVSTLQTQAQNATPTTISSSDYFLEPVNPEPDGNTRYNRIEIDESSTAAFESGDTRQRSISVAGSWGWGNDTETAGTVDDSGGISSSDTALIISDSSKVEVGDTLLIDSEQIFVSGRNFAAKGSVLLNMGSNLAAVNSTVTVTLDSSHGIVAGEVIRIGSEQMFVISVSTNDLTVIRAFDGSVLAAHNDDAAIHVNRTLTIERGLNGTTAASHSDSATITRYRPDADVARWALAEALATWHQEHSGWGRSIGTGDNATELTGREITQMRQSMVSYYRKTREAVI